MRGLTRMLTDSNDSASLAARARRRRWDWLHRTFPNLADMTVIDLGGVVGEWRWAPVQPARVTVVNLYEQASEGHIDAVVGDACELPDAVRGQRYDLVFSNSVIDQVGGHARRLQFADSVFELAPRHWIQTAYRYFPIDAVTLVPFQPLLPLWARAAITRHWPFGYRHAKSKRDSVLINLAIEGLSKTAFGVYFPDSEIAEERVFGLVKSLVAIKSG